MTPDPVLLIVFPLIAAFFTPLVATFSKKTARFIPLIGVLSMGVVAVMILLDIAGTSFKVVQSTTGGFEPPWGINLVVAPLSALISVGMIGVATYVLVSNIIKKEKDGGPWFELMTMMATAGAVGRWGR